TVKAWIAKSKEPSQPTTTLQALVNLKRPSIRLSPLVHADGSEDTPSTQHGLEFDYDLDAARGRIVLEVISPTKDVTPILIFESVVDGGFNKQLKVEDGAVFELAKLENHKDTPAPAVATTSASPAEPATTAQPVSPVVGPSKKRFSAFHFRKKTRTAGPALPLVDAQTPAPPPATTEGQTAKPEVAPEEDEGGVRVRIRIEALDENDKVLASPNAQTTYLHIVRMGPPPQPPADGGQVEEDTRQWVVKVVKREATIGLHTFHLHEIYGLATGSNSSAAPAPSHSYPPEADEESHAQAYDFAGTECVLCLSEPREVVLLPCRHLVACKDCAMNMIEFGAGGTLTHNAEDTTPAAVAGAAAATTPATGPTPAAAGTTTASGANANANNVDLEAGNALPAPPVIQPTPRRKRKAKGWFCPVCRQPYTSMLRITTTPPEAKKLSSASDAELAVTPAAVPAPNEVSPPPPAVIAGEPNAVIANAPTNTTATNTGSWSKPGFLRGLSLSAKSNESETAAAARTSGETSSAAAAAAAAASAEPAATTTAASTATPAAPADPLGATSAEARNGQ
ncbi:hypothetical protein FRC14_007501, partial [Serendipita sp. 396]